MEQIGTLIKSGKFQEPPEIKLIKDFVRRKYRTEIGVRSTPNQIILLVPGAALGGALRPELHLIRMRLKTTKKLVIRIDS
jgi:hypothetical protein